MAEKDRGGEPLEELRAVRARKRDELLDSGVHPYSNTFRPEHHASDVRAAVGSAGPPDPPSMDPIDPRRFRLAGRIMVQRSFGKAAFLDLADRTGRIQIYVKKGILPEDEFKAFKKALILHADAPEISYVVPFAVGLTVSCEKSKALSIFIVSIFLIEHLVTAYVVT